MRPLRTNSSAGGVEAEYREYYLPADIQQIALGIWVWVIPYLAFSYIDYLLFRDTGVLTNILLLRIAYALTSVFLLIYLKYRIHRYVVFDRVVLGWALVSITLNLLINMLRPVMFLAGYIFDLVLIFSLYILIPNRAMARAVPALALSICDVWLIWLPGNLSPDRMALLVAYLLTNVIGLLFSERLLYSRLAEFAAHRREIVIRHELERLASTDPLTGVYNRRRLLEVANESLYRFHRYNRPFSLVLIDMDGFKRVNDTFGHMMGDAVLIQFSQMLGAATREADSIGRMGGDEFCLVLPETLPQSALKMAERILKSCEAMEIAGQALDIHVTVSIGITEVMPEDSQLDTILARSDVALYRAKNEGRNRVVVL